MSAQSKRESSEYATRVCGRLGRRLQDVREGIGKTKYGLWQDSGVSRDMIGCVEGGESIATLFVAARLSHGMGMTLEEFVSGLEDR